MEVQEKLLLLQSSPHIASPVNSQLLMRSVLIALLPVTVCSVLLYGLKAILLVLVCTASAVVAECAFRMIIKQKPRASDLSAIVTGLLLALTLPPQLPLWQAALGSIFAIVVAKEFFGGLGANVFNPALAGRAFLLASFPAALTTWAEPFGFSGADAVSTATPLVSLTAGGSVSTGIGSLILGNHAGTLGETSVLCILLGGAFLLITKTINFRTPLSMIVAAFVMHAALGMDPVYGILSGGLLFGAFFMATDYSTTPVTAAGQVIFGAGCAIITTIIRKFGGYPEGVMYSILIMNAVSPYLDRFMHKKYGALKK